MSLSPVVPQKDKICVVLKLKTNWQYIIIDGRNGSFNIYQLESVVLL